MQINKDIMKTAVEWLEEHSRTHECNSLKRGDIIKQAKAIEKQQIIDAQEDCYSMNGEQYYNETFKSE